MSLSSTHCHYGPSGIKGFHRSFFYLLNLAILLHRCQSSKAIFMLIVLLKWLTARLYPSRGHATLDFLLMLIPIQSGLLSVRVIRDLYPFILFTCLLFNSLPKSVIPPSHNFRQEDIFGPVTWCCQDVSKGIYADRPCELPPER